MRAQVSHATWSPSAVVTSATRSYFELVALVGGRVVFKAMVASKRGYYAYDGKSVTSLGLSTAKAGGIVVAGKVLLSAIDQYGKTGL